MPTNAAQVMPYLSSLITIRARKIVLFWFAPSAALQVLGRH
jgi:hypothetical protein